jgi:hypothetical protein
MEQAQADKTTIHSLETERDTALLKTHEAQEYAKTLQMTIEEMSAQFEAKTEQFVSYSEGVQAVFQDFALMFDQLEIQVYR